MGEGRFLELLEEIKNSYLEIYSTFPSLINRFYYNRIMDILSILRSEIEKSKEEWDLVSKKKWRKKWLGDNK